MWFALLPFARQSGFESQIVYSLDLPYAACCVNMMQSMALSMSIAYHPHRHYHMEMTYYEQGKTHRATTVQLHAILVSVYSSSSLGAT